MIFKIKSLYFEIILFWYIVIIVFDYQVKLKDQTLFILLV